MQNEQRKWGAGVPLALGYAVIVLMAAGVAAWGMGTLIAGAVVARGQVEVESDRQVVQHVDGGVVAEIHARDGDPVAAGDVVVVLDGTFLRSELMIIERQLAELFVRRARLVAERDEAAAPDFSDPPQFTLVSQADIVEQMEGQAALFAVRREALAQELTQLAEQQGQIALQIEGMESQLAAMARQQTLLADERADMETLHERRLVQSSRLTDLQREEARLEGTIGEVQAAIAEARARIESLDLERLRLPNSRREEAITELRNLGYGEIELQERRISVMERLSRLEVRAPVAGLVFDSRVAAVQSVVQPGAAMMYIVPQDQPFQVTARIGPADVDQVYAGQEVVLMFTAFDMRSTPEIPGRVVRVSADVQVDPATEQPFYEAVVAPDADSLAAVAGLALRPGMQVEVFLRTGDRTPLSYLVQPLTIYLQRAFREG